MSRTPVLLLAFALVVAGCGAPPGDPVRAPTTSISTSAPAKLIKVPDVSGMNHQDAQNTMQKAGLYNLREVDGTGQGRALLVDRNWVQTGQDPAPGTEVPPDTVITLTAVKTTER
ncbi:PASTA domain-containing protein [Amycolatopsis sp., V23-08]|uniref:PASTA domain-containing protein n=1 Tax=Amycolatopsis heterodermiae TaxID=3110235 RepID=A0ABU5RA07_9PSEU|nr:PASTA domain-containing protein [Amycolatopsis sp., V23-08]MEA5362675.1 PASTA domain-containing protein [Amycolatopsis sp., V23-08]